MHIEKKKELNYLKKEEFWPSSTLTVHSERSSFQNCMRHSPKRCHYETDWYYKSDRPNTTPTSRKKYKKASGIHVAFPSKSMRHACNVGVQLQLSNYRML